MFSILMSQLTVIVNISGMWHDTEILQTEDLSMFLCAAFCLANSRTSLTQQRNNVFVTGKCLNAC